MAPYVLLAVRDHRGDDEHGERTVSELADREDVVRHAGLERHTGKRQGNVGRASGANLQIVRASRDLEEVARVREREARNQHVTTGDSDIDGRGVRRGVDHANPGVAFTGLREIGFVDLRSDFGNVAGRCDVVGDAFLDRDGGVDNGGLGALATIDVSTSAGATAALGNIEAMMQTAINASAAFGSDQSRVDSPFTSTVRVD